MSDRPDAPHRAEHRRLRRAGVLVALFAAALVVVGTIGDPLIGARSFHGAAVVYGQNPWREDRPADLHLGFGPIGDTVDSTMPNRKLFGERFRDGELALWNPYPAGGVPLGATSQSGVASPMNVPFLVLPAWMAPAFAKLLEMAVAGGFTFLFLRRLGIGRIAAVLGGTAAMTAGFAIAWNNWQHPQVAALIPALFWATERHLQERRPGTLVPIALATAVMLVGGFPAVAAYGLVLLVPYVGFRLLEESQRRWAARRNSESTVRPPLLVGLTTGVGVVLGTALAAFVVLPFQKHLGTLELGFRHQNPDLHLPISALATSVVPNALGAAKDDLLIGGVNTVETLSFVGAVTVLLVAAALLLRSPQRTPRGVRTYFAVALLATVVLTYVGGPLLELAQKFPVFDTNFVGRLRSILGFEAAVLAGIGAQSVLERRWRTSARSWIVGVGAVVVLLGFVGAAFLEVNDLAAALGERWYVARQAAIPLACGSVALVVVVWLLTRGRAADDARRRLALSSLGLLFAIETLVFVVPRLPRIDRDDFYPTTEAHDFLAARLGDDRFASSQQTMYPNTNSIYGLASITGHAHHQPTWAELLAAADPTVFSRSPTYSILNTDNALLDSAVFDRMAARYFLTPPGQTPAGTTVPPDPAPSGTVTLGPDDAEVIVPAQPLRGVTVDLVEAINPTGEVVEIAVTIEGADGREGRGTRRLFEVAQPGPFTIPVAGEDLPTDGEMTITLHGVGDDGIDVRGDDGEPALGFVLPEDDGLRVVFVDGAIIYARENALPRVRWADRAITETDPAARLALLVDGVPADTVVLSDADRAAPDDGATDDGATDDTASRGADVEVVTETAEELVAHVDAARAGWLVIADAKQNSWVAEVDGEEAPLLDADHALVAVAVPSGEHEVRVRYQPAGRAAGIKISIAAIVSLLLIGLVPLALDRRRRSAPRPAST